MKLKERISLSIIPNREANTIVAKWHYLHTKVVDRARILSYGVFLNGILVGVVMFCTPHFTRLRGYFGHGKGWAEAITHWQVLMLTRVWLSENAPKHSESCAIGKALRLVAGDWDRAYPPRFGPSNDIRLVISYADLDHGHEGTIYRAANFSEDPIIRAGKRAPQRRKEYLKEDPRAMHRKRMYYYWLRHPHRHHAILTEAVFTERRLAIYQNRTGRNLTRQN